MAITVTHTKVSTIPDGDDSSLIRPSDWNSTHTLTGLGTMAEQNANAVAITGGTISGVTLPASNITGTLGVAHGGTGATTLTGYVKGSGTSAFTASGTIPNTDITGLGTASTKDAGVANGVATLDGSGTVPISQLPAAVLGALSYQGTWNASTNTPTLTSSVGTKGYYYVVDVAGSTNLNGITDWKVGDWAVFNGSVWQKIDNTDAVTSVNGYTGTVVLTNTDISGFGTMSTQNANAVAITGGTINGAVIGGTTPADITGSIVTANTRFVSENYYAQSILGGNLRTSSGTSLLNWDGGGSGNITFNGGISASPANKNIVLSPSGTGVVTINPATAGSMNNVVIGGTTPLAITGTTITATTFSGSGASLTSIPNSALVNSSITINGSAISLGGSVSVGTVTSVAATAGTGISVSGSPITTSGTLTITNTAPDQTVVLTAGTGISTSGTYPNFTITNTAPSSGGTVTSVAALTLGTTGTDLSSTVANSTTTPVITLNVPTASATNRGALSAADWSTFNGKAPAVTYTTNYVPYGQGTTTPAQSANFTFNGTNLTVGTAGVSSRIQGDFTNATVSTRTAFQTGTTNGATGVYALPNGTSTAASWQATNAADPTNASKILIATNGSTDVQLVSGINGTGTYLPMTFYNNGAEKMRLSVAGGLAIGSASDAGAGNLLVQNTITATKYVGVSGGTF